MQHVKAFVAETPGQVVALRGTWEAMGFRHRGADLDVVVATAEAREDVDRPHVVVAAAHHRPVAMLIGQLEEHVISPRFGYFTVFRARRRCLRVVHGGIAGPRAQEAAPVLVSSLLESLRRGQADLLLFSYLDVESAVFAAANAQVSRLRRQLVLAVEPHWTCDLPDNFDTLTGRVPRSSSHRRYARRLERTFPGLEVRRYHRPGDLERVLQDIEAVAARTYQRRLGAGWDAAPEQQLIKMKLERGWFRAWVLYIHGVPRAFEVGDVYRGTYFLDARGYDPDWSSHRLGNYVALQVWRDLCHDPDVRRIDFGPGDADYKREAATAVRCEANLMIFPARASGIALNVAFSGVLVADRLARRLVGSDRAARIKRWWRDLKVSGARSSQRERDRAAEQTG